MGLPVIEVLAPPPQNWPAPGILRPQGVVEWTGTTGPDDVLHEWDTDSGFPSPITDTNAGASSPDTGVPPSDMGGAGTTWFYRVTVTDTSDSMTTTSATIQLDWYDPQDRRRYLYLLVGSVGFSFGAAGEPDGDPRNFRRYLWLLASLGPGFFPTDTAVLAEAVDGDVRDFRRYLYLLAGKVDGSTPTPHIWYLFPTFGREGWEFRIIGYGFGDTQPTYSGTGKLNALAVGIISWELVGAVGMGLEIDPAIDLANPIHQLIRATVPAGGTSGVVVVCTDAV
jgi:hypothetical protein